MKKKTFFLFLVLGIITLSSLVNPVCSHAKNMPANEISNKTSIQTTDSSKNPKSNLSNEYNQNLSDFYKEKRVEQQKQETVEKPPSIFRLIFSLIIVIGLIYLLALVYSKLKGINTNAILAGKFQERNLNNINVLATSSIGQGKNLHLVEVNGKKILIGSTINNISLLTEIDSGYDFFLQEEKLKQSSNQANTEQDINNSDSIDKIQDVYKEYLREN